MYEKIIIVAITCEQCVESIRRESIRQKIFFINRHVTIAKARIYYLFNRRLIEAKAISALLCNRHYSTYSHYGPFHSSYYPIFRRLRPRQLIKCTYRIPRACGGAQRGDREVSRFISDEKFTYRFPQRDTRCEEALSSLLSSV